MQVPSRVLPQDHLTGRRIQVLVKLFFALAAVLIFFFLVLYFVKTITVEVDFKKGVGNEEAERTLQRFGGTTEYIRPGDDTSGPWLELAIPRWRWTLLQGERALAGDIDVSRFFYTQTPRVNQ